MNRPTPESSDAGRLRSFARRAAVVSLLASLAGVAGSVYSSWMHEFVPRSSVRRVSWVPLSILGPAPVHAASAATRADGLDLKMAATASTTHGGGAPVSETQPASDERRPASGSGVEIRKRIRADHVAASLERAYAALRSGDTASAAAAYRDVLEQEPRNRDAALGLAAAAAHDGRWDEAAGYYAGVLALHPDDPIAQAAFIAMEGPNSERAESRLKALLFNEPRAAYLHFVLGNVYAAQSRWPEARLSYFNAHRFDGTNPDYAFNLAVSLDHLAESESALDRYRQALVLAQVRPASFEPAAVLARIRVMESTPGADAAPTGSPRPDSPRETGSVR